MREMKNSGVAWIGEIPAEWSLIRFKDKYVNKKEVVGDKSSEYERLALTLNGVIKRPKDDAEGLQPKEFDGYQILRKNDFVFKMIDLQNISTSRVGLSPYTGLVSPAYIKFSPRKEGQNNKFVYYYLMSLYYNCVYNNLGGNGVRSALNAKDMGEFVIPYPYETLQTQISALLDVKSAQIDILIANQKAQIEKLKQYKQSLITEVVTKGLNPDVEMKDSELDWIVGSVPKHWVKTNPKALFKLRKEKALSNDRQLTASQNLGIVYQDEYMASTGQRVVTVEKDFDILKHVEAGDFVISMRSFQGGLEYSENVGCISSAYVMLVPELNYIYPRFYKWLFKSDLYINAIQSTSNLVRDGQAMRYSNFSQIWLYKIPIEEQIELAEFLDQKCTKIDKLIEIKQTKITKLNEYKKSLIYEYVTGKKEVV